MRRIEFTGVSRIDDVVLRRELLQLESTYLNTAALDRSLARLERLPYVASAVASLQTVGDNLDLVDIIIHIVEAPARHYGIGGAYSGALRGRLHGYFIDENVGGSGRRFEIRAEGNELFFSGEISYTDPYARLAGVSRTLAIASRRIERLTVDSSAVDTELDSARLEYAYRVAELGANGATNIAIGPSAESGQSSIAFGIELGHASIEAGSTASEQLRHWISAAADGEAGAAQKASFRTADLLMRWHNDTRNAPRFTDSGRNLTLTLRSSLPGSGVRYYRIDYDATHYWPLRERWTATLTSRLGIGGAYNGDLPSLPPHLNWLAGGPATVRGYRDGTLGPRDSGGRPYGGDLLFAAQAEWLTPWPRRWEQRVRTGFFFDVGNVFSAGDTVFADPAGAPVDYSFDAAALRQSIGLVARLQIPFGTLSVSYALPLDEGRPPMSPYTQDDIERLQLTVRAEF